MLGHTPIRYPAVHDSMDALRAQFDVAAEECVVSHIRGRVHG